MARRRMWLRIVVLVAVQVAAISVYRLKQDRSAEPEPFASETLEASDPPVLAFAREDGQRATLAELRGTPVMVHFWATWCGPCRSELPGLLALARELSATGGFQLVAVAVDDDWDAIRRFFTGSIPRAIVRPDAADVHLRFGATMLPDTYLVDAQGKVVVRYAGARDWNTAAAREHLAQALATHGAAR
jgi:thiol-disulfide isomerase/thioredoxin